MDFPYWKLGKEEEIRTAQRKTAQFWAQAQQTPAWLGQFGNRENDPYVERTEVTMLDVGGAQPPVQKRTRYVYDQYNNVRFIREHQPSDDALLRETERTYKTDAGYTGLNAHLRALLASETVRSGGEPYFRERITTTITIPWCPGRVRSGTRHGGRTCAGT